MAKIYECTMCTYDDDTPAPPCRLVLSDDTAEEPDTCPFEGSSLGPAEWVLIQGS